MCLFLFLFLIYYMSSYTNKNVFFVIYFSYLFVWISIIVIYLLWNGLIYLPLQNCCNLKYLRSHGIGCDYNDFVNLINCHSSNRAPWKKYSPEWFFCFQYWMIIPKYTQEQVAFLHLTQISRWPSKQEVLHFPSTVPCFDHFLLNPSSLLLVPRL